MSRDSPDDGSGSDEPLLVTAPTASDCHGRLYAQSGDTLYRLFSAWLNLRGDGSFYVSFARAGETDSGVVARLDADGVSVSEPQTQPKGFRLSYHPTGQLNYHDISAGPVLMEPLAAITHREPLVDVSIPDVSRLDPVAALPEDASVIELPADRRITLTLAVDRADAAMEETDIWAWTWAPAFSLRAYPSSLPEALADSLPKHFHYVGRRSDVSGAPRMDQESAKAQLFQRLVDGRGDVRFSPDGSGQCRIVYVVPMRIPPDVRIELHDSTLLPELVEVTTTELKYRAREAATRAVVKDMRAASLRLLERSAEL